MSSKKIIVSVTNDLSMDQRVEKVCATLFKNGFEVTLVGRKFKNSYSLNREYKTKRFSLNTITIIIFNNLYFPKSNIVFFKLFPPCPRLQEVALAALIPCIDK